MLAESIAKDLDAGPGDIRPPLTRCIDDCCIHVGARPAIRGGAGGPVTHEEAMATLDQVLEFMRGGLEALQRD